MLGPMPQRFRRGVLALVAAPAVLVVACSLQRQQMMAQHRWWSGLGPVLPHDTFPADCGVCHLGEEWAELVDDFEFDHERETGVPLEGAHARARCLLCHNDRGPVSTFMAQGCAGCHEDVHDGQLGSRCEDCHQQATWVAVGMIERHARTRFPLTGTHVATACWRCHPGAEVGNFVPTDTECLTCHQDDLARTTNHVGLGRTDNCQRCHVPTSWDQAEVN